MTGSLSEQFVLGIDLDGVVADFYARMREIAAEWRGVPLDDLNRSVTYGLPEWGFVKKEYEDLHRFAVTQRNLFTSMLPIEGAPQAIRRLAELEGVRVRVITHRLFISHFHKIAVGQTVEWLDANAVPYWDLCFMCDKELVDADVYVEDSPRNIKQLRQAEREVIVYSNSTNQEISDEPGGRAHDWKQAESMIRDRYHRWRSEEGRSARTTELRPKGDHAAANVHSDGGRDDRSQRRGDRADGGALAQVRVGHQRQVGETTPEG
jgi:5'(3')-deoxyribonucleotidase